MNSARLSFEKIGPDHAEGLAEALCDPRVYEFFSMDCKTQDELRAKFQYLAEGPPPRRGDESWIDLAVRRNDDGVLIGRLEATIIGRNAEVAYLFGPNYWGNGYARESLGWIHVHVVKHFEVTDFWACINPANEKSIRLAVGMGYEETQASEWPKLTCYDPGDKVYRYRSNPVGSGTQPC